MPSTSSLIRRRQAREDKKRQGSQRTLRALASAGLTLAAGVVLAFLAIVAVLAGVYAYFTQDLPSAEALQAAFSSENGEFFQTTRIYDRTGGQVIYEVIDPRGGDRQYIGYNALPAHVLSATVAIEDKTFFTNPGYDLLGIARALISNLQGEQIQGGSSITQQLVKNTLIPIEERAERSYPRKIREILLAAEITRRYSKEQILEWYLNTTFYGNLAYGIDAGALVYFGKHADQLTLAEAALLAAVPNAPGLNPVNEPEEAKQRQELVLDVMAREGFIPAAQAETAKTEPFTILPPVKRFNILAPHFSVYVRQQLVEMFGEDLVNRGGLKVITTLDLAMQAQAECIARTQVARLSGADPNYVAPIESLPSPVGALSDGAQAGDGGCLGATFLPPLRESSAGVDHHVTNAALVALKPQTGEILALLGSVDYWNADISGSFNVAIDGLRQPGSSFKPYTYLTAFSKGYSPATLLLDIPTQYPLPDGTTYSPENYDRQFHGPVSMRVALARSYNIPAVTAINLVGVDNVIRLAHRLGINSLELGQFGPALTLGGGEVTLLDHTYAFSVLANMGVMAGQPVPAEDQRPGYRTLDPVSILRVEDRAGKILYQFAAPQTQPILSPDLAYLINNVLSDNESRLAAFGAGNPLELADRPAAAKTGTTNDFHDNWTMGYVPQLAIGVWVGNSDNSAMKGVTGLTGAAPIWHALMTWASATLAPQAWTPPPGIVAVRICDPSGLLPTPTCQRTREDVFIRGNEPTTPDNLWQSVALNRETGKRATVCTPPELIENRIYQILPPEATDWVNATGLAQPPQEYDPLGVSCLPAGNAAILVPQPFAYVHGPIEISGTAKGDNFAFFRMQYGPGLYPANWLQIEGDRGEQIENGVLQTWNTAGLDGLYSLQLVVVKNDPEGGPFQFETSTIQVTVDNQPPTVSILAPTPNQEYTLGQDEVIILQPQVTDNLSIARVAFFIDGVSTEAATVPPYSIRWKISAAEMGAHALFARVYDAAGNFTDSEPVTITVK